MIEIILALKEECRIGSVFLGVIALLIVEMWMLVQIAKGIYSLVEHEPLSKGEKIKSAISIALNIIVITWAWI